MKKPLEEGFSNNVRETSAPAHLHPQGRLEHGNDNLWRNLLIGEQRENVTVGKESPAIT